MTQIDKAEALAAIEAWFAETKSFAPPSLLEAIDALPARGVGVTTEDAAAIRHSFDGYGWQYIDAGSGSDWAERGMSYSDAEPLYARITGCDEIARLAREIGDIGRDLGWHRVWERADAILASLAPTAAAQAREAHLREAAAAVRARYMGDNNREDMEVLRCEAAILALIEKEKPHE